MQLFAAVLVGAYLFGAYLALLTLFGYENSQAFYCGARPPGLQGTSSGFRVRADGSAIDGFCIGLVDPVRRDEKPVLVDSFTWDCR